jgi:porphobilinogen synthase
MNLFKLGRIWSCHGCIHDPAGRDFMDSAFPARRLRRLRMKPLLREMTCETRLSCSNLIYPLFVCAGDNIRQEVPSMPGVFNLSINNLVEECREVADLGIPAVILFGIPDQKDDRATGAWSTDGIIQVALQTLKEKLGDRLVLIADTCLCEYMDHGHCGIVAGNGEIENDSTLDLLSRTAVSQARAGADIIAPSDMMDGRIKAIRKSLDDDGRVNIPIMSYAAKFSSAFYGPFRKAAQSAAAFGDRKTHQMDPANRREALEEARLDVQEGADILMVKPALAYLDIISDFRKNFALPVAAYHVSGEYSMIRAAAANGWIDGERAMMEATGCIRRAGADLILTYFAKDIASRL